MSAVVVGCRSLVAFFGGFPPESRLKLRRVSANPGRDKESKHVAKFFKVRHYSASPAAHSQHEADMLRAAAGTPYITSCLGLYQADLASCQDVVGRFALACKPKSLSVKEEYAFLVKTEAKLFFLLMERCDCALQDLRRFPFSEAEAAFVSHAVLRGLRHLHGLGIVHGDVKPGNILVAEGGRRVLLGDLGLAQRLPGGCASTKRSGGTRGYLAPECLTTGQCSPASDLFAFGAVLYEMMFRTPAFVRATSAETEAATHEGKLPLEPCGEAVGRSASNCQLLRSLLSLNPYCRPTADEALESEWLARVGDESLEFLCGLFEAEAHRREDDCSDDLPVRRQWASRMSEVLPEPSPAQKTDTGSSRSKAFAAAKGVAARLRNLAVWTSRRKAKVLDFDGIA
ncbi:unnamed protein product [Effrenium voratum]|nr:unnamed protein product [Effrenium voratum]